MVTVQALYRFPVKSMAGERVARLEFDRRGVVADRGWAVVDADGKLASGKNSRRFRRMDPVFDLTARLDGDDVPLVSGTGTGDLRADDPGAHQLISEHFARPVWLRAQDEPGQPWFMDGGSVSLVGSASLQAAGELLGPGESSIDSRRTRTNIVLATDRPWIEEDWIGGELEIGGVRLGLVERVPRCRMVDIPQDGLPRDGRVLKTLAREREGCLAVYADVVAPGVMRVGDQVRLGDETERTDR